MKVFFALSILIHLLAAVIATKMLTHAAPKHLTPSILLVAIQDRPSSLVASAPQPQNQAVDSPRPDTWGHFLSSQQVESSALPLSNIDESTLNSVVPSGSVIRLRLYIDQYGHVVHIEKYQVVASDQKLQAKLSKILMGISFLPAKKNGLSVDSFQDIAFDFR